MHSWREVLNTDPSNIFPLVVVPFAVRVQESEVFVRVIKTLSVTPLEVKEEQPASEYESYWWGQYVTPSMVSDPIVFVHVQ